MPSLIKFIKQRPSKDFISVDLSQIILKDHNKEGVRSLTHVKDLESLIAKM